MVLYQTGVKMRFREFKLFEEVAKQKIYAIGDSHAVAIATSGRFVNLATNGRSAFSDDNITAVNQVDPGSLVVVSAGANDMLRDNKGAVVMRIEKILNLLLAKNCTVVYILFAETDNPKFANDRNKLREAVSLQLPKEVKVIDMGQLSVATGDGIHAPMGWYAGVATQVKAMQKEIKAKPVAAGAAAGSAAQLAQKPNPSQSGQQAPAQPFAIEVPKGQSGPEVADAQKALELLGYDIGATGVDGIKGPYTTAAVRAFQQNSKLEATGKLDAPTVEALNAKVQKNKGYSSLKKSGANDVKGYLWQPSDIKKGEVGNTDIPTTGGQIDEARKIANAYAGKTLTDEDWMYLLKTLTGESAQSAKSYAWCTAVILNRTRNPKKFRATGSSIKEIVYAPFQFEAVTGSDGRSGPPNRGFVAGPNKRQLGLIVKGIIEELPSVPQEYIGFTSANPKAYKTDKGRKFMQAKLDHNSSVVIDGSIFTTV